MLPSALIPIKGTSHLSPEIISSMLLQVSSTSTFPASWEAQSSWVPTLTSRDLPLAMTSVRPIQISTLSPFKSWLVRETFMSSLTKRSTPGISISSLYLPTRISSGRMSKIGLKVHSMIYHLGVQVWKCPTKASPQARELVVSLLHGIWRLGAKPDILSII